jgi:hypothetical protein
MNPWWLFIFSFSPIAIGSPAAIGIAIGSPFPIAIDSPFPIAIGSPFPIAIGSAFPIAIGCSGILIAIGIDSLHNGRKKRTGVVKYLYMLQRRGAVGKMLTQIGPWSGCARTPVSIYMGRDVGGDSDAPCRMRRGP